MGLKKGMEFIHKTSKETIIFGKKMDDGRLWCVHKKDKTFIKITLEALENEYVSVSEINKKAKERRSRQSW